jgi:hypothetical protein
MYMHIMRNVASWHMAYGMRQKLRLTLSNINIDQAGFSRSPREQSGVNGDREEEGDRQTDRQTGGRTHAHETRCIDDDVVQWFWV